MKEEDLIRKQFGNANPFRVPEGYFDNLSQQIMDSLPAQEIVMPARKATIWHRLRPYSVAAAVCAVVFGVGIIGMKQLGSSSDQNVEMFSNNEEYTIDQVAEYAMVDNVAMYRYISSQNSEDTH